MQKVRRLLVAAILFVTATQVPATVHAAPPNPTLGAVAFGIGGATVAKRNR